MSRSETLAFVNLAHFLDHFFVLIFPTAAIAIASEWGLDYGAALALGTPLYLMFALGTLPAGWLGDHLDRTLLMAVFFVGCGASSMLIAVSRSSDSLMLGLGLLGLFASLYHPIGLALVSDIAVRTGRAVAVNGVFGNLGLAAAAIVTGALAQHAGWRSAFLAPGIGSMLAGGVVLARRMRKGPPQIHRPTRSVPAAVSATGFHRTVLGVVCVSALFGGMVFNATTISLPKLFDERLVALQGDLTRIGAYTGLVFAVAAFAQLPIGELLDRFGPRAILISLLLAQIALLVGLARAGGWAVVGLALALVTLIFAEIPITSWLLGHYIASSQRARAASAEYVLSLGVSAAVVPAAARMHAIGLGFAVQLRVLAVAVAAAVVLIAALFLPASSPQPRLDRTPAVE